MIVKIKKLHEDATMPTKAHESDAGFDLVATSIEDHHSRYIEYGTGLAIDIPSGYVGLLFPRSSLSNYALSLSNSVGVLDAGFHGEIKFRFRRIEAQGSYRYGVGDRIGQLVIMPLPVVSLHEVGAFQPTPRGDRGYGSTGQ